MNIRYIEYHKHASASEKYQLSYQNLMEEIVFNPQFCELPILPASEGCNLYFEKIHCTSMNKFNVFLERTVISKKTFLLSELSRI